MGALLAINKLGHHIDEEWVVYSNLDCCILIIRASLLSHVSLVDILSIFFLFVNFSSLIMILLIFILIVNLTLK